MGKKKSKKKNNTYRPQQPKAVETVSEPVLVNENQDKEVVIDDKKVEEPIVSKNSKNAKNTKSKKKDKPNSVGKKIKATVSELKKVTWPSFGELCKQTGVVLAFCLVFVLILLGLNSLLGWLFDLITKAI